MEIKTEEARKERSQVERRRLEDTRGREGGRRGRAQDETRGDKKREYIRAKELEEKTKWGKEKKED